MMERISMVRKNGKLILCLLAGVILVGLTACSTRKESSAMENRENGLYPELPIKL